MKVYNKRVSFVQIEPDRQGVPGRTCHDYGRQWVLGLPMIGDSQVPVRRFQRRVIVAARYSLQGNVAAVDLEFMQDGVDGVQAALGEQLVVGIQIERGMRSLSSLYRVDDGRRRAVVVEQRDGPDDVVVVDYLDDLGHPDRGTQQPLIDHDGGGTVAGE